MQALPRAYREGLQNSLPGEEQREADRGGQLGPSPSTHTVTEVLELHVSVLSKHENVYFKLHFTQNSHAETFEQLQNTLSPG